MGFGAVGGAAQWEGEEETGKISVRAGEFLVPEGKPPGRGSRGDPGVAGCFASGHRSQHCDRASPRC